MRAIVDGETRKQVLEAALRPLARTRGAHVAITDLRQVPRLPGPQRGDEAPLRDFAFIKDQFPMFEPLRSYFRHQREYEHDAGDESAPIDEAAIDMDVRRFAMRVLNQSRRAAQHAWALQHLAERFSAAIVRASSPETQELWRTVVRDHALAYRHETALLRSVLEPITHTSSLLAADASDELVHAAPEMPGPWARIGRLLDLQYYLLHLPATTPLVDLVALARRRRPIEQQYCELKDDLGLDHFEGRSYAGWTHHVALAAVAFTFLEVERARHPDAPRPTLPTVRGWVREVLGLLHIIHNGLRSGFLDTAALFIHQQLTPPEVMRMP